MGWEVKLVTYISDACRKNVHINFYLLLASLAGILKCLADTRKHNNTTEWLKLKLIHSIYYRGREN